jgi:hypothetical protein
MYSKKSQTFTTVPKQQDIKDSIDKKKKTQDYETIRNIVLDKSKNIIENNEKNNHKPIQKFSIV